MTKPDPLVEALKALCAREGDYRTVADKAKVSPDNLWQILNGTRLPSGNARGVGPALRTKISAAFPEWLSGGSATAPATNAPIPIRAAQKRAPAGLVMQLWEELGTIDERSRNAVLEDLASMCSREHIADRAYATHISELIERRLRPPPAAAPIDREAKG
jgi:hypothetical protein